MTDQKGKYQKTEKALICPQCNAPLTAHPFASSATCTYCGTTVHFEEAPVPAEQFHRAFKQWNSPERHGFASWISLGSRHWALEGMIAQGERSDVYRGRLARWPTERVLVKVLRQGMDARLFERGFQSLQTLKLSNAPGADHFGRLIPQPVMQGKITGGDFMGRNANIYRWQSGFKHTFTDVMQTYPKGIPVRASIWVWRRMLEMLTFIHNSGMAHGAVLPAHLLLQQNEHGVRLVGYTFSGLLDTALPKGTQVQDDYAIYYPLGKWPKKGTLKLSRNLDIIMSARCVLALLGGDLRSGDLPAEVPPPLAEMIRRHALADTTQYKESAWDIRQALGAIADQVYGEGKFVPIRMPGECS